MAGDADVEEILLRGSLELQGRLVDASNASFLGTVELAGVSLPCIYKPVAGERPLWDFPHGTLAGRELAARVVSEAGGFGVVPPTVVRDGRFGSGMVQRWISTTDESLVDVVPAGGLEPGWLPILEAEDDKGEPVLLVHRDDPRLRSMAVFDVVVNNADRKGGHVLPDPAGAVWGCDHGVCFHSEPKLRTVLWGWGGEALRETDLEALRRLEDALAGPLRSRLDGCLTAEEVNALAARASRLQRRAAMPSPDESWPAIPWPAF